MEIDPTIFRAYDIRGVYGKTLTEQTMRKIGMAVGTLMLRRNLGRELIIGNDIRSSSTVLSRAFINGITSMGINVTDVGTTSFGVTLFSGWKLNKDVTAYITASHNPPEWNGIKFFDKQSVGFFKEVNAEIGRIVSEEDFEQQSQQRGEHTTADLSADYSSHLHQRFSFGRPLKIVVDCGNGSTSLIAPELFKSFGNLDAHIIFSNVDPMFSDRGANVEEKNLQKLGEKVRELGADIGVGFDGDGDRVGVVDNQGNVVRPEKIMVMLCQDAAHDHTNCDVVVNVECSMLIENQLESRGVKVHRVPVGHTFMMQSVNKHNAVFGGEPSCHYVIPHYFPFDDAVVAALKMAEIMSKSDKPLSEIAKQMPVYPKERMKFECEDATKFEVVKSLQSKFSGMFNIENVNTLDGVRVSLDSGWFLIRASNTSPVVRLTAEASTQQQLEQIKTQFAQHLTEEIERVKTLTGSQ